MPHSAPPKAQEPTAQFLEADSHSIICPAANGSKSVNACHLTDNALDLVFDQMPDLLDVPGYDDFDCTSLPWDISHHAADSLLITPDRIVEDISHHAADSLLITPDRIVEDMQEDSPEQYGIQAYVNLAGTCPPHHPVTRPPPVEPLEDVCILEQAQEADCQWVCQPTSEEACSGDGEELYCLALVDDGTGETVRAVTDEEALEVAQLLLASGIQGCELQDCLPFRVGSSKATSPDSCRSTEASTQIRGSQPKARGPCDHCGVKGESPPQGTSGLVLKDSTLFGKKVL
jgi:hypothetical protein